MLVTSLAPHGSAKAKLRVLTPPAQFLFSVAIFSISIYPSLRRDVDRNVFRSVCSIFSSLFFFFRFPSLALPMQTVWLYVESYDIPAVFLCLLRFSALTFPPALSTSLSLYFLAEHLVTLVERAFSRSLSAFPPRFPAAAVDKLGDFESYALLVPFPLMEPIPPPPSLFQPAISFDALILEDCAQRYHFLSPMTSRRRPRSLLALCVSSLRCPVGYKSARLSNSVGATPGSRRPAHFSNQGDGT